MAFEDIIKHPDTVAPLDPVDTLPTKALEQAQREVEDEPKESFGSLFLKGRELDNVALATARHKTESQEFEYDGEWDINQDWELLAEGMPTEDLDIYDDARSLRHAMWKKQRYKEEIGLEMDIAKHGLKGFGARLGANLTDEAAWGLSILTPQSAPAVAGYKFSRLARAGRAGLISATENMILDELVRNSSQTRDLSDVAMSGLAGFILGAPLGALGKADNQRLVDLASQPGADAVEASAIAGGRSVDSGAPAPHRDLELADDVNTSVGGAEAIRPNEPLVKVDEEDDVWDAPYTAYASGRAGVSAQTKRSENPVTRKWGGSLVEDAVGNKDTDIPTEIGASEIAARIRYTSEVEFYRAHKYKYKDWVKEQGISWASRNSEDNRLRFNEEVSNYIESGEAASEAVKATGDAARKVFAKILKEAKKAGVAGADEIPENANYLPHLVSHFNVRRNIDLYNQAGVEKLIAKAIKNATPDLEDAVVKMVAKRYLTTVRRVGVGMQHNLAAVFSRENTDVLKKILKEEGMDDDFINSTVDVISGKQAKEGKTGKATRMKRRTAFDMETTVELLNKNTGRMEPVSIKSLFERDAEGLMSTYTRQMSGQIALAQKGIKSRGDFDKVLNQVRSKGEELGQTPREIDGDVENLEFMYKAITGHSLEKDPMGWYSTTGRRLRAVNFLRVMNQVGFAQMAEMGNILGYGSWKIIAEHMPGIRTLSRDIQTGKLKDELALELEDLFGFGADWLRHSVHVRHDEWGMDRVGNWLDDKLERGKKVTSAISGMAPINTFLHRLAAKTVAQRFLDVAHGKKNIYAKRFRAAGLSNAMQERVFEQMRKHTAFEDSKWVPGKKLKRINIEAWDDQDAAEAFTAAAFRISRKIIQENDIGSEFKMMHSATGKIFTQFRTFMISAYEKQFLHNLNQADWITARMWLSSMTFGGLAYMLQTGINYQNDPAELKKRMSPERIGAAAFQRAGFASIFPGLVDTASMASTEDPLFAYGRSTGLQTGFFAGNPTVDTVTKMMELSQFAGKPLVGKNITKYDVKNALQLLPFSNATIVRNLVEELSKDFPKR